MYNCQTRKRQRWQKGAEALIRKQISYPEFELSSNSTFDFKWLIIMITVMLFRPCLKAQSRSQSSAQATMTYGQSITRCFWLCIVVSSRCALCSTQQLDVSSSSLSLAAWLPEAWESAATVIWTPLLHSLTSCSCPRETGCVVKNTAGPGRVSLCPPPKSSIFHFYMWISK